MNNQKPKAKKTKNKQKFLICFLVFCVFGLKNKHHE